MEAWQTVEFWAGVSTGILAMLAFWAWSSWVYGKGRKYTEKPEVEV